MNKLPFRSKYKPNLQFLSNHSSFNKYQFIPHFFLHLSSWPSVFPCWTHQILQDGSKFLIVQHSIWSCTQRNMMKDRTLLSAASATEAKTRSEAPKTRKSHFEGHLTPTVENWKHRLNLTIIQYLICWNQWRIRLSGNKSELKVISSHFHPHHCSSLFPLLQLAAAFPQELISCF